MDWNKKSNKFKGLSIETEEELEYVSEMIAGISSTARGNSKYAPYILMNLF